MARSSAGLNLVETSGRCRRWADETVAAQYSVRMMVRTDGIVSLTLFTSSDAPVMYEGDHDLEMRKRFDCPDHFVPSLEHSRNVITRWERERAAGQRFPFAVREASSGALAGGCELRPLGAKSANVSYWTYPAHRRRGVASRAVALLREPAFTEFGINRLEIVVVIDNVGSRRVALCNGFIEVGMREGKVLYIRDRG